MISTERRMLRYNFTPDEHLANCAEMARLIDSASELEASHKQIKAQLKEDAESVTANIGRFCRYVRDKADHRETECRWELDKPGEGHKRLLRIDTGDTVEIRAMTDLDKQGALKFTDENQDELPLTDAVVDAIEKLRPEAGSSIESVTISAGGESVTLHQAEGPGLTHAEKVKQRRDESAKKAALAGSQ